MTTSKSVQLMATESGAMGLQRLAALARQRAVTGT
jgi:hypothetical protein